MAWRVLLSNRPIRRLDICVGKPSQLAVWTHTDRASFLDLQHGSRLDERIFEEPSIDAVELPPWKLYLETLKMPNEAFLPYIRARAVGTYTSLDGGMRVFWKHERDLTFVSNGKSTALQIDSASVIVTCAMDRALGLIALLDRVGRLYIYQQHIRVGVFDIGLRVREDLPMMLAVADGGNAIYVTDGQQIVIVEPGGKIRKRLEVYYAIGAMGASPDGKLIATSDIESNVIRVYNGADLTATYQRFAVDLLADTRQAQVLPVNVATGAALGPLAISSKGVLAFAMAGMVCVTNTNKMGMLPKPQSLT
jgi:hypothetical protein